MEFAMLSQLFYASTVHSKPSGELKSNVAYCRDVFWISFFAKVAYIKQILYSCEVKSVNFRHYQNLFCHLKCLLKEKGAR